MLWDCGDCGEPDEVGNRRSLSVAYLLDRGVHLDLCHDAAARLLLHVTYAHAAGALVNARCAHVQQLHDGTQCITARLSTSCKRQQSPSYHYMHHQKQLQATAPCRKNFHQEPSGSARAGGAHHPSRNKLPAPATWSAAYHS